MVALDMAEGGQIQTVTSVISADKRRHLGPWSTSVRSAAAATEAEAKHARHHKHDCERIGF